MTTSSPQGLTLQYGKFAGARATDLTLDDLKQAHSSARLNTADRRLAGRELTRRGVKMSQQTPTAPDWRMRLAQ